MVNFSVFNELSLPLKDGYSAYNKFGILFKLLAELKGYGLNTIRMDNDFQDYCILPGTTFNQFFGQQQDRDFKTRLKSFITSTIIKIQSPLIETSESEQNDSLNTCEYFYKEQSNTEGLAAGDIWNTIVVSFDSDTEWDCPIVDLTKKTLADDGKIDENIISVKHGSQSKHLSQHQGFFKDIEKEARLNITRSNFWNNKEGNFPALIKFCPEIESQIRNIDKTVFDRAISILRDIETGKKLLKDFNYSGESQTVSSNSQLRELRLFTIDDQKEYFENHIKSLPNGHRLHFLEKNQKIYIGYIGKHLPNTKDK